MSDDTFFSLITVLEFASHIPSKYLANSQSHPELYPTAQYILANGSVSFFLQ